MCNLVALLLSPNWHHLMSVYSCVVQSATTTCNTVTFQTSWLRFKDDNEIKWVDFKNDLDNFIAIVNSFLHYIKFTIEFSTLNNTFLDTSSTLVDGKLDFNFHTKPPDSYLNLKSSSCYPPHTFRDITKGLATRVRGICSTQELYSEQS